MTEEVKEVQPTSSTRSIIINVNEDNNIGLSISGEFKTFEFYGLLLTTMLDVISSNLINDVVNKMKPLIESIKPESKDSRLAKIMEVLKND